MSILDPLFDSMEAALDQVVEQAHEIMDNITRGSKKLTEEPFIKNEYGGVTCEEMARAITAFMKLVYHDEPKAPKYERKKQRLKIKR